MGIDNNRREIKLKKKNGFGAKVNLIYVTAFERRLRIMCSNEDMVTVRKPSIYCIRIKNEGPEVSGRNL